ncbi:ribonuclease E/G [Schaalia georgiae]|uniref:ribonuclease E/G n=1 Tax=Schaalia georgiae TaxID=52768 RepID=UPI0004079FAC|nr:ribonuclease E/G [Schaalia georgiae]
MTPELDSPAPVAPAASLLFQAPVFQEPAGAAGPGDAPSRRSADAGDEPKEASPRRKRSSRAAREDVAGPDAKGAPADDGAADAPPKKRRTRKNSSGDAPPADGEGAGPQEGGEATAPKRRRRAKKEEPAPDTQDQGAPEADGDGGRRRRRRRPRSSAEAEAGGDLSDQVKALKGSTRLEAKKQRRREGRREGRRRHSITESEFLARRESVKRAMVIRDHEGLDQIAILEDDLLVEHYVARRTSKSVVGNIYLGRVQNVLPSMEAAFVDIGRGRNAVLYAGEVNWDAVGLDGKPRRIESALKSGDSVLVQVTKDPIGHKGARLTSQITLAGRYLVLIPNGSMMGISRKLPDKERARLKKILKQVVPSGSGVIVRTAAEGASEEQIRADVDRLTKQWEDVRAKQKSTRSAPALMRGEPELAVRVVRDIFNEDFTSLVVQGRGTYATVKEYVDELSPELSDRVEQWVGKEDVFHAHRIDEQLAKGMDRKVWLPSGGTLIIDRTEAMTVIDVNTGKYIGAGGTLEETVTRNNLEAAEEIVRQLRLRDIGGIVIIDFVDMVLESNRDLVLRRLVECLGRDRTRHQVTEITSLGLVQMTRKRVGEGLVEAFSTQCDACEGRGFIVHSHPVEHPGASDKNGKGSKRSKKNTEGRRTGGEPPADHERAKEALSAIAAATRKDEAPAEGAEGSGDDRGAGAADGAPKGTGRARRKRAAATAPSQEAASVDPAPARDSAAPSEEAASADPAPRGGRAKAARRKKATAPEQVPASGLPADPAPGADSGAEDGSQRSAAPSSEAAAPAAAGSAAAAKPRRRRAASAGSVEPEAAPVLELPERVAEPAPAAATMTPEEITLPAPAAQERPKRRRRAVSTGVVDAG